MASSVSDRQKQILMMLASGYSQVRIARELYWSRKTVSNEIRDIKLQFGAKSVVQAVAEAIRRGLIN